MHSQEKFSDAPPILFLPAWFNLPNAHCSTRAVALTIPILTASSRTATVIALDCRMQSGNASLRSLCFAQSLIPNRAVGEVIPTLVTPASTSVPVSATPSSSPTSIRPQG